MISRPIGVCLIGPGNVGGAVLSALRSLGDIWQLRSVVVRERRPSHEAARLPTTVDGEQAVTDPGVDVVIDANSDTQAGLVLAYSALRVGKVVVTANKGLAVQHGPYLQELAATWGGAFGYDAAVCAALPVTAVLRQHCALDRITEIEGLLSGTCNFILSAMQSEGLTVRAAVKEAQRLGYAEPDAREDLNGLDAARKTALVTRLATNRSIPLAEVSRVGIDAVTPDDHLRAAARGQAIRLISRIRFNDDDATAWVAPILIDNRHPFAHASGPENVLRIHAERLGTITVSGLGAGAAPTAAALLGDACALQRRRDARRGPDFNCP